MDALTRFYTGKPCESYKVHQLILLALVDTRILIMGYDILPRGIVSLLLDTCEQYSQRVGASEQIEHEPSINLCRAKIPSSLVEQY